MTQHYIETAINQAHTINMSSISKCHKTAFFKHSQSKLHNYIVGNWNCLMLLVLFLTANHGLAQRINTNGVRFTPQSHSQTKVEFNLTDIHSTPFDSNYATLTSPATNGYQHHIGKPSLPEYHQIIQVPSEGKLSITIESEYWETYSLQQLGCILPIHPAGPASIKSITEYNIIADSIVYGSDSFYGDSTLTIRSIGSMRDNQIALLTISPVRYNPLRKEVKICHSISATISSSNDNPCISPLYNNPLQKSIKQKAKDYTNDLTFAETAHTYLIVAHPKFQETLQPFISWKKQEGYIIEEYYPESYNIDLIKAHLQQRYDDATPNHPAPFFILLIGDIQEIPVWTAQHRISGLESHQTDLYYAEFTGDYLPDALLGRISVSDTATLRQIINKTLTYERFELIDSTYLNRSLLVAGKENTPPAPIVTNGQINYLKSCIIQHDSLHDTICYYNPASDTLFEEIHQQLRQGVGFINYTSHCTVSGWMHPRLSIYDIDSMTLGNYLFVSINNCCRANAFSGNCFGEHLLRKAYGGAVGVIGASNETLWDEDYYWCVGGNGEPSLYPEYNSSLEGAYDRLFHTHSTSIAQHALTQSQIVLAGNWAVTASGSPYDAFYWEIYSVLGDPSLMPYIGIPKTQHLNIDTIYRGDVCIYVQGMPGARVSATWNDTLYGVCTISDSLGTGVIHTSRPILDSILITSTAQYHKPLQTIIVPLQRREPFLVVTETEIHNTQGDAITQLTLCDTAIFTVHIRNIGDFTANNHYIDIYPENHRYFFDHLHPQQDTSVQFVICPKDNNDVQLLIYNTGKNNDYWTQRKTIDLLRPNIQLRSATLLHNSIEISSVLPNSDYTLNLNIINNGNGKAKDLCVSVNGITDTIGNLNPHDSIQYLFDISIGEIIDSLSLTIQLTHRTDSLVQVLIYPKDSVVIIPTVSITQPDIRIQPNPADNHISISGFTRPTRVTIFDTYGRIVKEFFAQNGQTIQYSTQKLRCGIYCIHFISAQSNTPILNSTKKLLIVR